MVSVYVKIDGERNITMVNSNAFLGDPVPEGWIKVDEGTGDAYFLAQNNYLPQPLMTDDGKYRWRLDGSGQIVENDLTPTLDELKAAKRAEIAAARYAAEISGITLDGVEIRTDRESQALITGAALAAMQDENYILKWKAVSGFVELGAEQVMSVAQAVRQHVQSCFDREAELQTAIEAAETEEELNGITWEPPAGDTGGE